MNLATRLEAHALIDQLVEDGETFSREAAARLIELVPVQSKGAPPLSFSLFGRFTTGATKGHAAGVGDVSVPGEEKTFSAETTGDEPWRLGGYKVVHRPGKITIDRFMEAVPGRQGRTCELLYDAGGPRRILTMLDRLLGTSFWAG